MKAPFSTYLDALSPALKALVDDLKQSYEYVSILATDSVGFGVNISQRSKSVSSTNMTTERGNVVRVYRNGQYSEYAFNEVPEDVHALAEEIRAALAKQEALLKLTGTKTYETGLLEDEPLTLFVEKETERLPEEEDMAALVQTLTDLSNKGMETIPSALDCMVRASSTHISKMFLSPNRDLRQSYVYTEGSIASYAPNEEGEIKFAYEGVSGCCGPEVLTGLNKVLAGLPKTMEDFLSS